MFGRPAAYLVRGSADAGDLAAAIRAAVHRVDARLPISGERPLMVYVDHARAVQRFTMIVIVLFAATAVVLAAVGLYGVIACHVVERRREFGVRIALGATRRQITALVLADGAVLTGAGVAIGAAAAFSEGRVVAAQLFGVTPHDALTYAAVVPVLFASALAACWWPARRATRANPLEILRVD
jgi:putative ABC transport system permease protein